MVQKRSSAKKPSTRSIQEVSRRRGTPIADAINISKNRLEIVRDESSRLSRCAVADTVERLCATTEKFENEERKTLTRVADPVDISEKNQTHDTAKFTNDTRHFVA